jgi:hypothetical protein
MAMFCLFVGAGRQKCYQIKVDRGDQNVEEEALWRLGVFFYGQAIPFVITTNIVYFGNLRKYISNYSYPDQY